MRPHGCSAARYNYNADVKSPDCIKTLTRDRSGKFKYSLGLLETPTGAEARTHKITLTQKCEVRQVLQGSLIPLYRV